MATKIKRTHFMCQWANDNALSFNFSVKDGARIRICDFPNKDYVVRNWDIVNDCFGAYLYAQSNNLGEKGRFIPFIEITHYNGAKLI